LTELLLKEFEEIEKNLDWGNYKIAQDKLEKIVEKELSNEGVIFLNLLNSKNPEMFNLDERLKFAEKALARSKQINNQKLILKSLIAAVQCKQETALFKDSLDLNEQAEELLAGLEKDQELVKIQIELLYFKGICLTRIGKLDLAYEIFTEGVKLAKQINEKKLLMDIYFYMGVNRGHVENYDLGLELGFKSKEIAIELDHKIQQANTHVLIGTYYQWTGKYRVAKEFFEEGIEIMKQLNRNHYEFIFRLGLNHYFVGELNQAIELFEESFDMSKNLKNSIYRLTRNNIWAEGLIAWKKGELDKAIKYMTDYIEYANSVGDKYHTNLNSIFLAAILFEKGQIDEALELTLKALNNLPSKSQNYSISLAQQLLGKIYQVKGEFNLALHHAQQSYSIQTKMEVTHHLVETLLLLISISVEKGDLELAENYLDKLVTINQNSQAYYFKQIYIVGQALILKAKSRPKKWIKAIELLEGVVNDDLTNHQLTVLATINLCELLINEFSISGDVEVLLELEEYTRTLINTAQKQNNYYLKLEAYNIRLLTLWLEAQYSIAEIDIQKAKQLLLEARDMADEEGLISLAEKITQQYGDMIERMEKWDEYIRKYYEFIKQ